MDWNMLWNGDEWLFETRKPGVWPGFLVGSWGYILRLSIPYDPGAGGIADLDRISRAPASAVPPGAMPKGIPLPPTETDGG